MSARLRGGLKGGGDMAGCEWFGEPFPYQEDYDRLLRSLVRRAKDGDVETERFLVSHFAEMRRSNREMRLRLAKLRLLAKAAARICRSVDERRGVEYGQAGAEAEEIHQ